MTKESMMECKKRGREKTSFKLFGVDISAESNANFIKRSVSLGNLGTSPEDRNKKSTREGAVSAENTGYHSDGVIHRRQQRVARQKKKGKPWTEEEHRTFLIGMRSLGKGDWRGISKSFVTTRTPTQIASHAQKYFLRQSSHEKKKRRASLLDIDLQEADITPKYAFPCCPFMAAEVSSSQVSSPTHLTKQWSNYLGSCPPGGRDFHCIEYQASVGSNGMSIPAEDFARQDLSQTLESSERNHDHLQEISFPSLWYSSRSNSNPCE